MILQFQTHQAWFQECGTSNPLMVLTARHQRPFNDKINKSGTIEADQSKVFRIVQKREEDGDSNSDPLPNRDHLLLCSLNRQVFKYMRVVSYFLIPD